MTAKIILVILFVASLIIMSFTKAGRKKRILFLGDSITAEGMKMGGYIVVMDSIIKQENTDINYQLIGAGISGNKVYDLYLRLEEDVISKSADIVVIYIGVNDIWHKIIDGTGTDEVKFEQFYRAIIQKLQYNGSKVILCTPAIIGERKELMNEQDSDLNIYSDIVRKLTNEFSLPLVDLRQLFIEYNLANNLENLDKGILTTDGVHLNARGNVLVSNAIWEVIKTVK